MNTILLCEGKTDAVLLGYYINKIYDYQHINNKYYNQHETINKLNIKDINKATEDFNWYGKSGNYLAIWSVGGNDNLKLALKKLYNQLQKSPENNYFEQLVLVLDRDQQQNNCILLEKYNTISENININFSNQKIVVGTFNDSFNQPLKIKTLAIVIPPNKSGALETLLLDSLKDNKTDQQIVEHVDHFIEMMKDPVAKKYLRTNRLVLKAKLSTVFAIMSPEKVFNFIDDILKTTIKWENKTVVQEIFGNLEKFLRKNITS